MLENIYGLLNFLFPYQWMDHTFMKNAFLAILLVTPLFGLLGTMVVSNKMAFFSDSLGHGAFTGIAIGVLLGGVQPLISIVAFSIVFAIFITYIKNKSSASTDTIIGVFSSTAIAIGLMMMSHGGGFGKFSSYLIGDLLSISSDELAGLLIVFLVIIVVWMMLFNKLLIISINTSLAASRGIHTSLVEMVFASLLAVVVAISIQWVGLLIINSMLVLPAAAARNIANNVKQYHILSVMFSLGSGIVGLIASYYCNTATGATVVLVAASLFFITLCLKHHTIHS
ncbi:metal ABC transporter permease [Anaerosinus massiliensis]|uniref:metal ABC transporter permease n=1 Tax=Massilibacillus massiliensis TaxID=1806837 RepID=UPI000AAC72F2|nr:metal ABC transporter permease [Massilibacillus massiliensis]